MKKERQYVVELLNPAKHRRGDFRCESPELTDFLHKRARKEMDARASACFVLVAQEDQGRIAGYFTLSAAEVLSAELPEAVIKKLPRYRVLPATLLGRLARDVQYRGEGIGDRLIMKAFARAWAGSAEVGSVGIVTDPKDRAAEDFYREFNFQPLSERRMFLPMPDVARLLKGAHP